MIEIAIEKHNKCYYAISIKRIEYLVDSTVLRTYMATVAATLLVFWSRHVCREHILR